MSIPLFKEAMRQVIATERALQILLDTMLKPTGRQEESWTVYWVREGEHGNELEAMFTPPSRCYSLHHATIVNLQAVQEALGADYVSASQVGDSLRYRATWKRS